MDVGVCEMSKFIGQAGKPAGVIGRLFGRIMAWHNRPDNEWTLDLLEIGEGDTVLEVGFGPGQAVRMLAAEEPRAYIVGIDHSETMLSTARRTNQSAIVEGRVSLQQGSVDRLPYASDTFDKAFSINCIYFWEEPLCGARELCRVLKNGGRLAITVRDKERAAYRPFRAESLVRLLTQAGFSSISVHHNGSASRPLICVVGVK